MLLSRSLQRIGKDAVAGNRILQTRPHFFFDRHLSDVIHHGVAARNSGDIPHARLDGMVSLETECFFDLAGVPAIAIDLLKHIGIARMHVHADPGNRRASQIGIAHRFPKGSQPDSIALVLGRDNRVDTAQVQSVLADHMEAGYFTADGSNVNTAIIGFGRLQSGNRLVCKPFGLAGAVADFFSRDCPLRGCQQTFKVILHQSLGKRS